jgi:hypothetical protein
MIGIRRVYRRVTTTDRIVTESGEPPEICVGPIVGESFRVEVIKTDGEIETTIYSREHAGSIEVAETLDGNFRLKGTTSPKELNK